MCRGLIVVESLALHNIPSEAVDDALAGSKKVWFLTEVVCAVTNGAVQLQRQKNVLSHMCAKLCHSWMKIFELHETCVYSDISSDYCSWLANSCALER